MYGHVPDCFCPKPQSRKRKEEIKFIVIVALATLRFQFVAFRGKRGGNNFFLFPFGAAQAETADLPLLPPVADFAIHVT